MIILTTVLLLQEREANRRGWKGVGGGGGAKLFYVNVRLDNNIGCVLKQSRRSVSTSVVAGQP